MDGLAGPYGEGAKDEPAALGSAIGMGACADGEFNELAPTALVSAPVAGALGAGGGIAEGAAAGAAGAVGVVGAAISTHNALEAKSTGLNGSRTLANRTIVFTGTLLGESAVSDVFDASRAFAAPQQSTCRMICWFREAIARIFGGNRPRFCSAVAEGSAAQG